MTCSRSWISCLLIAGSITLGACGKAEGDSDSAGAGGSEEAESSDSAPPDDLPSEGGGECLFEVPNDCMDPELKCMPWGEGMAPPTESRCCDLSPSPVSFGERCQVEERLNSCLDNCPAGSLCIVDDIETLTGYCIAYCDTGDPDSCGADQLCRAAFDNNESFVTVPMCADRCDPLQQDCESKGLPGWVCQASGPTSPSFFCHQPTGSTAKVEYEECKIPSDCSPGLGCLSGDSVLGCEGLSRCCTSFCDTASDTCTDGNVCTGLDSDVPGLESVGLCASPG